MQLDSNFYYFFPVDPEIAFIPGESMEQLMPPLKRSFSDYEVEEIPPKRVRWSSVNEARVLREVSQSFTDAIIEQDNLVKFLKEQNAYDGCKLRHHRSTYRKSEDPEEVKEIEACLYQSVKIMTNKKLLKNYRRLVSKQRHIFCKREVEFQADVKRYIFKYEKELVRRKLLILP